MAAVLGHASVCVALLIEGVHHTRSAICSTLVIFLGADSPPSLS